jgi:hypothetical protein
LYARKDFTICSALHGTGGFRKNYVTNLTSQWELSLYERVHWHTHQQIQTAIIGLDKGLHRDSGRYLICNQNRRGGKANQGNQDKSDT